MILLKNGWSQRAKRKSMNMLFVLPLIAVNVMFFLIPFIKTIYMSGFNWPLLGEKKFIGLDNFGKLLNNVKFINALGFTLKYALLVTPMIFITAFVMAVLVNKHFPGVGAFRTIFFMPVVISMSASANIWLWIYNELYGVLNYILLNLGLIDKAIAWMHMPSSSLPAICVMVTWKMSGFTMLMLLGAFQSIDDEIYQAANIDGANAVQRFSRITLPLVRPTMGLALIISVIGSVLAFEQFRIMTAGGPSGKTQTAVYYIYDTSFKNFKFGYGAAMSIVLLVILAALSLVQYLLTRDATE